DRDRDRRRDGGLRRDADSRRSARRRDRDSAVAPHHVDHQAESLLGVHLQRDRHSGGCGGALSFLPSAALAGVRKRRDGLVEFERGPEQSDAATLQAGLGVKYFHRTALSPDDVLAQARTFFGARLAPADEGPRRRTYAGALGKVTIGARAEGGHYTL